MTVSLPSSSTPERAAAAVAEAERLAHVEVRVDRALERAGLEGDVRTEVTDRGLVLSLVSRHVVFAPDVAELSPRGRRVVDAVAADREWTSAPVRG